jgi:starch-binding outer membrane protein SusE/F
MKNFINFIFIFSLGFIVSCEDEKNPIVTENNFELLKDLSVASPSTLLVASDNDVFSKFSWNESNNGPESVSSYKLVISDRTNDPNFLNEIEYAGVGLIVTPNLRSCSLTVKEMNSLINKLPTFQCGEMNLDVRIKSILGSNPLTSYVQYSNPINIKVTGYATSNPILSFVRDGNAPGTEPKLLSTGYLSNSDYEAYLYLQAGSYKFVRPDACGSFTSPTILGGTGALASGTIDASATPASIAIPNTGHYLIKANLTTNTYSIKEFRTFGIFGDGVRISATGNAAPMADNNDNVWKITVDLIKGRSYRFKSNLWTGTAITPAPTVIGGVNVQFPDFIPPSGTTTISTLGKSAVAGQLVEVTGSDGVFTVPGTLGTAADRQKYEIILDVSKPRKYTYTITPK